MRIDENVLLIHSSLKALGSESPAHWIKEFEEMADTIMMPAFTGLLKSGVSKTFDVNKTPIDKSIGIIPETLRKMAGTHRSCHPSHSVVARGQNAEYMTAHHELCTTPFGKSSPLNKLVEVDGSILLIGKDQRINSSVHCFEDRTPNYPVNTYYDERFKIKAINSYGESLIVKTALFNPEVSKRRDYGCEAGFKILDERLRDSGRMREGGIGYAPSRLMKARDLMNVLTEMLEDGITIYR